MGLMESSEYKLQKNIVKLRVLADRQRYWAMDAREKEKEAAAKSQEAVDANLHKDAQRCTETMFSHQQRADYCLDMVARIEEIIDVLQQQSANVAMSESMQTITGLLTRITTANGDIPETMQDLQTVLKALKEDEVKIAAVFGESSNRIAREKRAEEHLAFMMDRKAEKMSEDLVAPTTRDASFEAELDRFEEERNE